MKQQNFDKVYLSLQQLKNCPSEAFFKNRLFFRLYCCQFLKLDITEPKKKSSSNLDVKILKKIKNFLLDREPTSQKKIEARKPKSFTAIFTLVFDIRIHFAEDFFQNKKHA